MKVLVQVEDRVTRDSGVAAETDTPTVRSIAGPSNQGSPAQLTSEEVAMLQVVLSLALLVVPISAAGQEQPERTTRQLPAPTDIDPQLTEELRRAEQNRSHAILRKDANALERLVGPEFTLRVADVR
jgi:hypothetical protein